MYPFLCQKGHFCVTTDYCRGQAPQQDTSGALGGALEGIPF